MRQIRQVLRLANSNEKSQRSIARSLNISRDAVADYITRAAAVGLSWPLPEDMDDYELERRLFPVNARASKLNKAEPNWVEIHLALKTKGSTLQVLHEEYLAGNLAGMAYSYFCERYREYKRTLKRYMRHEHVAGDKVFVDYAGPTIPIVINAATGEIRYAQIFVAVLGASRYIYADAAWSQSLPNWIGSHVRMFEHFGGVPAVVVCDNLKAAVTRASRNDPTVNDTYQNLADHYGMMIIPARPYKPKDKAYAENGVLVVERWIIFRLRKRVFGNLVELNAAIKELLVDVNNRAFQKLPGNRLTAFQSIDRPALSALPLHRYEFAQFVRARVGLDYHVELDNRHFYSVPYALVRREVDIRLTEATVEILNGGKRVASHPRSTEPGKTTDPAHMDPAHRYLAQWDAERELDWAMGVGASTHAFMQVLLAGQRRRELAMRSVGAIKSLVRVYGEARLESGCARALSIGATQVRNLKSILQSNLDLQPATSAPVQEASFDHENIRGPGYYH